MKLNRNEVDTYEDVLFKNIARVSSKFIILQIHKKLIKGVCHNTTNDVIDDICEFNSQVEDFRVIGRSTRYIQMYFQVYALASWKTLIDNGKGIFMKYNLNILLKRTKAKGWNRKIGMLVGPKTEVAYLKEYEK